MQPNIFSKLGFQGEPVILAPLAGVSDHPFRRICTRYGASLTYVEMISSAALIYNNAKTMRMLTRHPSESILGVQLTGRSAEEVGQATEILNGCGFDTIDINMGCPVQKVVKSGCGSAILKDPQRVYDTVKAAVAHSSVPVTAKIRLGWDHDSKNAIENAQAIEAAGGQWITVHGRTRSDDYAAPVDLESLAAIKQKINIPLIGNGNIFTKTDAAMMRSIAKVDGLMVSRGALGNPWVFAELTGTHATSISAWTEGVLDHIRWHREEHGGDGVGAITMRKHLLWYLKGWPYAKPLKEALGRIDDLRIAEDELVKFADGLKNSGCLQRDALDHQSTQGRFLWDPKYDMDRQLDRGVGAEGLEGHAQA